MKRTRAKELLPIIQAYAEGKKLQYKVVGYEDWHDVDDEDGIIDIWVKHKVDGRRRMIVGFGENFVEVGVKAKPVTLERLFETYTFLDNEPCGVKEK